MAKQWFFERIRCVSSRTPGNQWNTAYRGFVQHKLMYMVYRVRFCKNMYSIGVRYLYCIMCKSYYLTRQQRHEYFYTVIQCYMIITYCNKVAYQT